MWVNNTVFELLPATHRIKPTGSSPVAQSCANAVIHQRQCRPDPPEHKLESSSDSIVFIGSVPSHIGTVLQNISAYGASKAIIRGLVKPLAMELATPSIGVHPDCGIHVDRYDARSSGQAAAARETIK